MADIKGKKAAHTDPSSHSGHLAPLALLPGQGLTPGKDYEIKFSGKHEQSVLGVNTGDYDAAHVSSATFFRMAERGQIKNADFRILYRSQSFPAGSWAHPHDLKPELAAKLVKCFADRIVGISAGLVVFDGPGDGLTDEVLKRIYGGESWLAH